VKRGDEKKRVAEHLDLSGKKTCSATSMKEKKEGRPIIVGQCAVWERHKQYGKGKAPG